MRRKALLGAGAALFLLATAPSGQARQARLETQPAKPDLVCSVAATAGGQDVSDGASLKVEPGSSIDVAVTFTVKNEGDADAAGSYALKAYDIVSPGVPGASRASEAVGPLGKGGKAHALSPMAFTVKAGAQVTITGTVDTTKVVPERKEDNNICTLTFTTVAKPRIGPPM